MKKKTIKYFLVCFTILIVTSFTSLTYSKYIRTSLTSEYGSLATPTIVIGEFKSQKTNSIISFALNKVNPNSIGLNAETYTFSISNGTPDLYSEIALQYTITIATTNYLPLDIILYNSTNTPIASINKDIPRATTQDEIIFPPQEYQKNDYSLVVSWETELGYDQSNYAGVIDILEIFVYWEQLD